MKALSIRQPWAGLILLAGKDVENRQWATNFRGRVLIHAAKGCTRREYDEAMDFVASIEGSRRAQLIDGLQYGKLLRGGIVGIVSIVGCVRSSGSPWFTGKYGFVLEKPRPLPFFPCPGKLGLFDVPDDVVSF